MIRFSSLEHTLDLCIADGFNRGTHQLGYLIIEGMSLNSKIELFRKIFPGNRFVVRLRFTPETLVKRLHAVRVFRNYLAHANWNTLQNTGYVRTKVGEKDSEIIFRKVRITPKVIKAWIQRVNELEERLSDFEMSMQDA